MHLFRKHRPVGYKDDRGKPVMFDADGLVAFTREQTKGIAPWIWPVIGCGVMAYFLIRAALNPAGLWPTSLSMFLPSIVFAVLPTLVLRHARGAEPALPINSATMLAHGVCGGCGYSLEKIETAPDGCRRCPECGSAWNTQRFIFADQKERLGTRLKNLELNSSWSGGGLSDDRGVLLAEPYCWPKPNPLAWSAHSGEVVQLLMRERRRRAVKPIIAVWALWLIVPGLALFGPADFFESPEFVIVTFALIAGVVSYAAFRMSLPVTAVRKVILGSGRCPQCSTALLPERVEFDGYTTCVKCLAAWKPDRTARSQARPTGKKPGTHA